MKPYPNPLIRIIIDDEDGELPSICISPGIGSEGEEDDDDHDEVDMEEEEEHDGQYGESLSENSSVDSFIQHLDSLHPFRLYI